jgi:hypothetical protein
MPLHSMDQQQTGYRRTPVMLKTFRLAATIDKQSRSRRLTTLENAAN